MGWMQSLWRSFKPLPYEQQKKLAESGTKKQRLSLAKSSQTNKEILFYLAEHDPETSVRQHVAQNKATPLQVSQVLAADSYEDVRLALSRRLVALLPALSLDRQSQIYAYTVQALGTLALDEVLKVRKSLAVTLKDSVCAPPAVVAQLAKDIEREVAEPILRFCVALEDKALVEILREHPKAWAAEAVAQRSKISAMVAKAVIGTRHNKAGQYLLKNKGADIDEDILHEIIIRAKDFPEWHKPLVTQHQLSDKMARRVARYTDARIRKLLQDKGGFDLSETEIVTEATRRRIKLESEISNRTPEALKKYIRDLVSNNKLNEDIISDHLALRDIDFVSGALAHKIGISVDKLNKALFIKKPEVICAICWKAGFSMRLAFRLQQDFAGIDSKELIVPRHGTDYPLSEKDMRWHLEFLDIE